MNEIIHCLRRRKVDKGLVGIKIDMNKAYDCIDWGVLNQLLFQYGFSMRVFSLISECYMVDSQSIILNGNVYRSVKVERGLKQDDPDSQTQY